MYWNGSSWVTLNPGNNGQTLTICNGVLTWTTGGICPANLPTLTTTASSAITTTTASSGGNISSDGGGSITARGVVWSTSQNPTVALTTKTSDGTGSGSFSSSLTDLSPNTLYYVRAYATNSGGTAYGNQISFTSSNSLFTNGGGVTDIDGNSYNSIIINGQEWMKENLKVSKYRNGDSIPTNLSDSAWSATTNGAFAVYNNDSTNNIIYGKLYNSFAVADQRGLCPVGWHVPTDAEWYTMEVFLDSTVVLGSNPVGTDVGDKLKAGSSIWGPNDGATNISGFSALPGGGREAQGSFGGIGGLGVWWSSTGESASLGSYFWSRHLFGGTSNSLRIGLYIFGLSVRCLRD